MKRAKLTVDRDGLSKLIRPWAERLVTDIAAALAPKIEALLAEARTDAITRLEAAFAPPAEVDESEEVEPEVVQPPRKPAPPQPIEVDEKATRGAKVVHRDLKPENVTEREPRKCRLCREVGHRADRCPNAAVAASSPPKPEASAPPPARADRFARIQAAARARAEREADE